MGIQTVPLETLPPLPDRSSRLRKLRITCRDVQTAGLRNSGRPVAATVLGSNSSSQQQQSAKRRIGEDEAEQVICGLQQHPCRPSRRRPPTGEEETRHRCRCCGCNHPSPAHFQSSNRDCCQPASDGSPAPIHTTLPNLYRSPSPSTHKPVQFDIPQSSQGSGQTVLDQEIATESGIAPGWFSLCEFLNPATWSSSMWRLSETDGYSQNFL